MELDASLFKQSLVTTVSVDGGKLVVQYANAPTQEFPLYPAPTVDSNTATVGDRVKFFSILSTVAVAEKSFAIQFLREPGYVKPIDVKVSFSTDEDPVVAKVTGTCLLIEKSGDFTVTVEAVTPDRTRTATLSVK
jgi:hypothetical protein